LQWDASGETLAVLPAGCSFVYTWTAATKELQKLETDFKASRQVTAHGVSWSQ
jgi:WD repeat-containing protein 19